MASDSHPGWIYLIGCEENSTVKIGWTRDLEVRLGAIQRMSPVKVRIIRQIKGDRALETRLHKVFDARRTHGEWFDFTGADPVALVQAAMTDEEWLDEEGQHLRPVREATIRKKKTRPATKSRQYSRDAPGDHTQPGRWIMAGGEPIWIRKNPHPGA